MPDQAQFYTHLEFCFCKIVLILLIGMSRINEVEFEGVSSRFSGFTFWRQQRVEVKGIMHY